jgi:hypothetical protein
MINFYNQITNKDESTVIMRIPLLFVLNQASWAKFKFDLTISAAKHRVEKSIKKAAISRGRWRLRFKQNRGFVWSVFNIAKPLIHWK